MSATWRCASGLALLNGFYNRSSEGQVQGDTGPVPRHSKPSLSSERAQFGKTGVFVEVELRFVP